MHNKSENNYYLDGLNVRQKKAVTAGLGPILVLAGAGSGKTRVLTYRIAYLIDRGFFRPDQILAVTFTNKAAKEMSERVDKLLSLNSGQKSALRPYLGTFHSIGARLLRSEIIRIGYSRSFTIIDSDDQLKIIKDILADLAIPKQYAPTLFRAYISRAKNLLQTPSSFNPGLEAYMRDLVAQVYVRYQDFIFKQNSLDFDDLLMLPIKIFEAYPEVLRKYQQLWRYILVDEYQDTNQAQYAFLHMLSKEGNLFVVGDDAQSIYGFRGSDIANILNFEKDYPKAEVIKLEQNYRSTKNILAAAQEVINLNSNQKPKTLWTDNTSGDKVIVEEVFDGRAEAIFVANKIVAICSGEENLAESLTGDLTDNSNVYGAGNAGGHLKNFSEPIYELEHERDFEQDDEGTVIYVEEKEAAPQKNFSILDYYLGKKSSGFGSASSSFSSGFGSYIKQLPKNAQGLDQFAVLYRTHSQSRQLEEIFMEAGIPYKIVGGIRFYERKEIKDALAFLRLILNPADVISLKRVVNEPPRGIGEKSFSLIRQFLIDLNLPKPAADAGLENLITLWQLFLENLKTIVLPPKQKLAMQDFYANLSDAVRLNDQAPLSEFLPAVMKISKLLAALKDGTDTGEARIENVKELYSVAAKFDHLSWHEGLIAFLEEVALVSDSDKQNASSTNVVTLMTLHAAKGLEFDTVFFVGLEENILPHSQSLLDPEELAEEIRLAYVGLTRARKKLFLLYAKTRQMFGSFQSNPPSRIISALNHSHASFNSNENW